MVKIGGDHRCSCGERGMDLVAGLADPAVVDVVGGSPR